MNCRETQQMIDRYLKNNLEESELQAFLDHVRECPSCYEELEIYYTIEYALGYLDNGKKGATNPTERLKEELKDKERVLHRHHLFGMFRTTVIGAALAALVICARDSDRPGGKRRGNADDNRRGRADERPGGGGDDTGDSGGQE